MKFWLRLLSFLVLAVVFILFLLVGEWCNSKTTAKSCDRQQIYIITPTYYRLTQKAELTRLVHTFKLVHCLHWIVVEDNVKKSKLVQNLLLRSGLKYTHLYEPTPSVQKLNNNDPRWKKARGVLQRNKGLEWIRSSKINTGIIYFADDDNTYDLELFDEMRQTKKVAVWPVGLVGKLKYESPLLNKFGKVVGWRTKWKTKRTFALDMAGFAINLEILANSNAQFSYESSIGELENDFLSQLVTLEDLEPKADNCTKVLVWHTQSKEPNLKNEVYFGNGQHNMDIEI